MMPIRAAKQRRSESRSRAAGGAMSGGASGTESQSRAAGGAMSGGAGAAKQRRNGIAEPRSGRSDGEGERERERANVQFIHPLSRI